MTGPYLRKLVREKVRENVLFEGESEGKCVTFGICFRNKKNSKVMRGNAPTATPQAEL